jgi:hypothetical protein
MNFQTLIMEKFKKGKQSLTPNGNDSDVPPGIHDGLESLAAGSDVNLGIGTPEVDYRIVYQLKYAAATSMCSRAWSVMTLVCIQYTRECIVWLDTPQHKGKRQIRPFAITSGKCQEVVDSHLS